MVELEPPCAPRPIVVPFSFEAALSGIGLGREIHERLRYRRLFEVPAEWRGSRVLLNFGAVDWRATVTVDGELIGFHTGGYTHFSFDLGELDPSRAHELVVDVEDPAEGFQPRGKQHGGGGIWYTRTTGIWQPVWLEAVPAVYVRSLALVTDVGGNVCARVDTNEPTDIELRVGDERVRFESSGRGRLQLERPLLWSPDQPALYDVTIGTETGDLVASYAAFRSIERRGRELLLNGDPIRLCGVLDQGFWPGGVYTPPSGVALRADVEAAKSLGFNLARKHVKVEDPRWYAWCDRLGVLVAQDLPSSHDLSSAEARQTFERETDEIVAQLGGHPSVVLWIGVNEDWGEPPATFQRGLVERLRAQDPGRLVVDASGWKQLDDTDLVDRHDYGDDLSRHCSTDELPLWIGECGGVSLLADGRSEDFAYKHVSSADELAAAYGDLVNGSGDVAGLVWTQLTDVEGELNGLLTADRVPKADPRAIRAVNERFRRR